jgi:hypothetical protein
MRTKYCVLFLMLAALCSFANGKDSRSSSSGQVHVHGYYRKDGTYVAPYDRSLPGSGDKLNPAPRPLLPRPTPRPPPLRPTA